MKKCIFAGIVLAIALLLFATALGLGILHTSDFLYRYDVDSLNISGISGLSKEDILENYSAVMSFLSPFSNEPFDLPSLAYSEAGAFHFEECRTIFRAVYIAGAIGLCAATAVFFAVRKKPTYKKTLLASGIATLAIPAALLCAVAIDFNKAFVLFHKLFFNNDYWIFSEKTDPVITILPQGFFMHCALFIAGLWIVFAALQLFVYSASRSHSK
ncbi:MAG: TIGR01906 family membrane protein [Oscillospiraceae bacterium]